MRKPLSRFSVTLLLGSLLSLPSFVSALTICDAVGATDNLHVRSSPSTSASIITTVPADSIGNILNGPESGDGYIWWYIKWLSGQSGWSVENYLQFVFPAPLAYGDSYGIGWCLYPWPNTTVTEQSSVSRVGPYGIATTTTAAWARLYLRTNAILTTGYSSLRFSVRGTSSNGQILYVALYNTAGAAIKHLEVADYVPGGSLSPNTWADVRIPIADLEASGVFIGGIVIESSQATTFYVDDVALDTQGGSTYWVPPSQTQANNLVYSDSLQMGWLTVDEYRTFFTWLQLHADQHVLDVGPPGANAGKFTVSRSSSTS